MSDFLKQYRAENPDYSDLNDDDLVTALHGKYNSDTGANLSIDEFNSAIEFAPSVAPAESVPVDVAPEPAQPPPAMIDEFGMPTGQGVTPVTGEPGMLSLVGEKLANLGAGMGERAGDIGASLLSVVQTAGRELEEAYPVGGFAVKEGDILPTYLSPSEYKSQVDTELVGEVGRALKDIDLGYEEQSNWQGVKDAFSEGGPLSGSAYAEVLEYGLEQGVKSIPDMVATIFALPTYIVARSGEIGEERAKNKGKDRVEVSDMLEAAPFAAASALLERIGVRGMTTDVREEIGREMLKSGTKEVIKRVTKAGGKALTKEAATEAMQEGMIEYAGERFGTDAKMTFKEALDRAAAGAVAGGVMGGAVGVTTAAVSEAATTPEKELAKAMEAELELVEPAGVEAEALAALSPDRAQIQAVRQKIEGTEAFKTMAPEDQAKVKAVIDEAEPAPTPEEVTADDVPTVPSEPSTEVEGDQPGRAPAADIDVEGKPEDRRGEAAPEPVGRREPVKPVDAGVAKPEIALEREAFTQPSEFRKISHSQKAELLKLTPEQAKAFEPEDIRDPVTGFYKAEDRVPTTKRAQEHIAKTGEPGFYVEGDIQNLGGLNEARGHSGADKVYRQIAKIFSAEVNAAGGDVVTFRHGGDEISAVVVGVEEKAVHSALRRAQSKVGEYIQAENLHNIEHPKHPGDATKRGIGLYLEMNGIDPNESLDEVFSGADRKVEVAKKGKPDVTGKQPGAVRAQAPDQPAQRVGERAGREGEPVGRDVPVDKDQVRAPEGARPAEKVSRRVEKKPTPEAAKPSGQLDYQIPTSQGTKEEIFHSPGHNYVGLYRSTGIPPRQEFVSIDGKTVTVPKKPQRIEPIVRTLVDIMGPRIYNGKIKGKSKEGFYRPGVGELRTRKKNDVEVLAHEAAHYLDTYSDELLPNFKKIYQDKKFVDEVKALSYTDANAQTQEIEGFAEFVRLWLTNAKEAQQRAPGFYDAFNQALPRDKKLAPKMSKLQEQMHKFYFQGADKMGQALIGGERSFLADFDQWKYRRDSRIRQQTIDRFHAARKIEQELTGEIGLTEKSAWKQFRLANGGSESITDYILNYGSVNFDEKGDLKKTGKSLYDVLAPVKTIDRKPEHAKDSKIDLLMRYFAGRRALELHSQGRENLIPKETAIEWARLGRDYPVFESIQKEYQAFNDRMMDFYVDAGMITADARKTMQSMNKDYVPFNRIRDALTGGKGPGQSFQKLKGGTANLNDILVNIQDGIETNVRAALNNKAKVRMYGYITNHKDGAIFATHLGADSRPVKVYKEEMTAKIERILEDSGVQIEGGIDLSSADLLTFWQHGVKPTVNESGNLVDSVIINGKKKYFEVQDPLLQEMLLSMNPESYSSFMNVMFGVKNFFTRMITLGVEFTGANLVRDTTGAAFLSKNNFKPFIDSFKGMYSFISKDKHYQDFLRAGGGYSSRIHANTREGTARRKVAMDEFGVLSVPEKMLSVVDNIASAFEYGTRIGEFRLAKKAGKTDIDAGYAGREISTDFSVTGANRFLTGYIRTIPFMNAMIQSQDRVYREALVKRRYDGNPIGMAMKAFLGITLPTLILWMVNRDDEDYKEIPAHEKRTNWHIKIADGQFIKIPRPYDVGFVYATMPELFSQYLVDEKGREFADGMIWTMTQMYGIDGVPAMMSGWWDLVRNEKWTGAPVVPKALQNVDATEQYTANTSETFIRLGQSLGVSPVKAEHMFKAYTGYLGGYLMWGTDQLMWDEDRFGQKPDRKASSNIFLRRFLTPDVRPSTATMEKFFDLKEKADKITATFRSTVDTRRAITGKLKDPGKFKDSFFGLTGKEKEVLFALNDSMNRLVKVIYGREGLRTKELQVRHDKSLSGTEKRKQIDDVWRARNKAFMSYYTQAEAALEAARKESDKGK